MSIRRACSYRATFTLKEPAGNFKALVVTISQNKQQIIKKAKENLELIDNVVTINLTQEETLLLRAGTLAQIQLRAYKNDYDAPGTKIFTIDVYPSLDEEVLS